jgi:uncharacterized membrane protein
VSDRSNQLGPVEPKVTFAEDFRRFFVRGLAALLPTLITLWLLVKIWDFLWESVGRHLIWLGNAILEGGKITLPRGEEIEAAIRRIEAPAWAVELLGVMLAVLLIYIVGLFVGNLIGRTMWRLAETAVMRVPVLRAVYPAVKQVTDYLLADKSTQFKGSRVVAVRPHANDIWSIALVTGPGISQLDTASGDETITVFVPSSPTAFSGYVMVVPRKEVVELPLKVEEAMRLLISGGVIQPGKLHPNQDAPSRTVASELPGSTPAKPSTGMAT